MERSAIDLAKDDEIKGVLKTSLDTMEIAADPGDEVFLLSILLFYIQSSEDFIARLEVLIPH